MSHNLIHSAYQQNIDQSSLAITEHQVNIGLVTFAIWTAT